MEALFETEFYELLREEDELVDDEWEDMLDEILSEVDFDEPQGEVASNSRQKVRWIQQSLNKILGMRLKADGIMGPKTRSAIRIFQRKHGLKVDGVVGQRTSNALLSAVSKNSMLPASSTVTKTISSQIPARSEFRARVIKLLAPLPPYPQEITSNGPQRNTFTRMTGLTHEQLIAAWAKGKHLTSCNAFTGWFSRAMGSKKYLGRFDLDTFAKRSWVPASSGRTPKCGDILRFKTFHVGIAIDLVDGILHTAEGGQGGPSRGFDAIKRKQMPWDPGKLMGWVDLENWIRNSKNTGLSLQNRTQYETEIGIGAASLGLATFESVRQTLTSGNLSVSSTIANYMHPSTPAHIPFKRRSIEFKITAHHPRYGVGRQQFFFELSFEYNGYDIKNSSISVLRSKSSSLFSSEFSIDFIAKNDSVRSEAKSRIAYHIANGRWDPVGLGEVSFSAKPLFILHANGRIQGGVLKSEKKWVRFDGFISSTLKDKLVSTGGYGQITSSQGGGTPMLRIGARGASVTNLQIRLNRWLQSQGRQLLVVDGSFGARTKRIVVEFQQASGLKPDGIVGAMTWGILKKYW